MFVCPYQELNQTILMQKVHQGAASIFYRLANWNSKNFIYVWDIRFKIKQVIFSCFT